MLCQVPSSASDKSNAFSFPKHNMVYGRLSFWGSESKSETAASTFATDQSRGFEPASDHSENEAEWVTHTHEDYCKSRGTPYSSTKRMSFLNAKLTLTPASPNTGIRHQEK